MEKGNQFLLYLRSQIDQKIAAGQDIQFGEGWIHDEILRCKNHHLANLFAHPVAPFFFGEETFQAFFRNIGSDIDRKSSLARFGNSVAI